MKRPKRPLSSDPVHAFDQDLENSSAYLRLAQAERLFRVGQDAICQAFDCDFSCILIHRRSDGWVPCASDSKTPLGVEDIEELRDWTKQNQDFFEESKELDLVSSPRRCQSPRLPEGSRFKDEFLISLPGGGGRFLVLLGLRTDDPERSDRAAKSFVNAVVLVWRFVEEDISARETFEELSTRLASVYTRTVSLNEAAGIIAKAMKAESCSIYLRPEPTTSRIERVGHHDDDGSDDPAWLVLLEEFLADQKQSGKILNSSADIRRMIQAAPTASLDGMQAGAGETGGSQNELKNMVLLHLHGRKPPADEDDSEEEEAPRSRIGALRVCNLRDGKRTVRRIRHLDLLRLRQIAAYLSLVLEARDYRHNSYTDGLTKLDNRSSLDKYCGDRGGESYALAFIDLDKFKSYNERFGYRGGDTAIQTIAQILNEAAEDVSKDEMVSATAFRQGGDEFVLTFSHRYGGKTLRSLAMEVLSTIQQRSKDPDTIRSLSLDIKGGVQLTEGISLSIGLYLHQPRNEKVVTVSNPRIKFLGLMEHQPERRPVILASIASRIAKSTGGGTIVEWKKIAHLACESTGIVDAYSDELILMEAGLRDHVREGFRFQTFHEFPETLFSKTSSLKKDTAFTSRTMATFRVERAYQDISVCKVISTEMGVRDCSFWIGRKVWIQI